MVRSTNSSVAAGKPWTVCGFCDIWRLQDGRVLRHSQPACRVESHTDFHMTLTIPSPDCRLRAALDRIVKIRTAPILARQTR